MRTECGQGKLRKILGDKLQESGQKVIKKRKDIRTNTYKWKKTYVRERVRKIPVELQSKNSGRVVPRPTRPEFLRCPPTILPRRHDDQHRQRLRGGRPTRARRGQLRRGGHSGRPGVSGKGGSLSKASGFRQLQGHQATPNVQNTQN